MAFQCGNCDSYEVTTTDQVTIFQYGVDGDAVMLSATVPVRHCTQCDFEWVDWVGMEAKDRAVAEYIASDGRPR
jgi:hypothetical protein